MKRLVFVIVTNLIFAFMAFGQPSCPSLSVTGPSGLPKPNEPWFFRANLSKEAENYKVEYIWEVTGGKIIEGQGTSNLKVLADKMCSVEVTVKVKGLPETCPNIISASASMSDCNLTQVPQDRYSEIPPQINKKSLSEFARIFQAELLGKAFILEQFNSKTSYDLIKRKLIKTFLYLTQDLGLSANRIVWQIQYDKENLTYLYYVSEGATQFESDVQNLIIKGEDFQNQIDKLFPTPKKKSAKPTRNPN